MNLILLNDQDFIAPDSVRLCDRRFQHVRDILGATAGQPLRVGLLGGLRGTARVLIMRDNYVDLRVSLNDKPPSPLPLTLVLALPRPKVCRRVLQGVTSMGVKRIILLNTWRVEKSYWQSPLLTDDALQDQLLLGLEQAGDTILPIIQLEPRFKPFVEDSLPALVTGSLALVAHPTGAEPCPADLTEPCTLAVGPEGGFSSYEIDCLSAAGFAPVSLGTRPLRVETAVPALLGRLMPGLRQ